MDQEARRGRRRRSRPCRLFLKKWINVGVLVALAIATASLVVLVELGDGVPIASRWAMSQPDVQAGSRLAAGSGVAQRLPLDLDGPLSAYFAGELVAAARQRQSGVDRLQFEPKALPGHTDFVAQVVRDGAIGVTTGQKFLLARWNGAPVVAFAASFLDTPTFVLASERSGIRVPKDLIGRTLGYRAGSESAVIVDAMMAQLGLPRSQLNLVPVESGLSALQEGRVAALIASVGDRQAPANEAARMNVIRPQDYGIHVPGLVYFASEALLRERPSLVRQALREMIAGWQQVYADVPAASVAVAAYDPARLKAADVDFALREQRDLVRPVGTRIADFDQSRWDTLRDILVYAKLGTETGSLSQAVTYDVLRDVYREAPDLASPGRDRSPGD